MAFATPEDVGIRLLRTLSEAETDAAELAIEVVTGLIASAVGEDEAWADALDPVPGVYRALCIEKAVTTLTNPQNVAAASETLGEYSWSQTYPRARDLGLLLTREEERGVRRIYNSGATRAATLASPYSGEDDDGSIFENDLVL